MDARVCDRLARQVGTRNQTILPFPLAGNLKQRTVGNGVGSGVALVENDHPRLNR